MINLLLGAPGGGKSYEAVVFHILPALEKGRKVITNLPLFLEEFANIDARFPALLDIRQESVTVKTSKRTFNPFRSNYHVEEFETKRPPFSTLQDYGDKWRHPVDGFGPLYVIDESQLCLPRGTTDKTVEEWFSLHRHEFSDVLLLTQSYGKVSKDICDMVQVVYRVRKNVAFGSSRSYTRKVQDGIRGEVVNTSIREYQKKFFNLYRSHTKSGTGSELGAQDIVPIWMRWPFLGAAACLIVVVLILVFSKTKVNPISQAQASTGQFLPKSKPVQKQAIVSTPANEISASSPVVAAPQKFEPTPSSHPFGSLELHISGFIESTGARDYIRYTFSASQNGMHQFYLSSQELEEAGYTVKKLTPCSVQLIYKQITFFSTCDSARVGMVGTASAVGL